MGRRKIEIQPITHERNRSVTFLKRKNGLFKKAYELGVLCSVDVAVIIFEDRPGHSPKLYQYSSRGIQDIVQRHLQHDGETDNRGPGDFSGPGGGKIDEVDEDDEEEEVPVRTKRKKDVGKLKPASDMNITNDREYPRNPVSINSSHSAGNNWRTLPASAQMPPPQPPQPSSHKRPRAELDDDGYGGYTHTTRPGGPPQPHHGYHQGHQYTPMFGPQHHHTPPPPPSFIPLHESDFPPQHDFHPAHRLMGGSHRHHDNEYPGGSGSASGGGAAREEIFPFVEGDARSHQQSSGRGPGLGLDWPVHSPAPPPAAQLGHRNDPQQQSQNGNPSWFDFLSNTTSTANTALSWERGGGGGSGAGGGSNRGLNDRGSDIAAVLGVGGNTSEDRYLRTMALPVGDTGDSRTPSLPPGDDQDGSKSRQSVGRGSGTPNPGPGGGTNGSPSVSGTPTIAPKALREGGESEEDKGNGKKMDVT